MKVKASELRIGSLVNFSVDSSYYQGTVQTIGSKIATILCLGKTYAVKYVNITPIVLTEELLVKLGWKYFNGRTEGVLTMDTSCKLDIDFVDGKMQVKSHYESFYRCLQIKYVHQLQNLFFELNREELTFKHNIDETTKKN